MNNIIEKIESVNITGIKDVDYFNLDARKLFQYLPFYSFFEVDKEKVIELLSILLDNYEFLKRNNQQKLDLFLMDFGWISHQRDKNLRSLDITTDVLREIYKFDEIILTGKQYDLTRTLDTFFHNSEIKNCFISAPTSFGKTFLVVKKLLPYIQQNKNILYIVPKINLINEISRLIKENYESVSEINISHSIFSFSNNIVTDGSNIFVCTAERYTVLQDLGLGIVFDLVIIDEAHLVYDYIESRSMLLSLLIKNHINSKIIYLLPGVDIVDFTSRLKNLDIEVNNSLEFQTNEDLVSQTNFIAKIDDENRVSLSKITKQGTNIILKDLYLDVSEDKIETKFNFIKVMLRELPSLFDKTIIYLSTPENIQILASKLLLINCEIHSKSKYYKGYLDYLDKNFPSNYNINKFLKSGIVVNIGPMDEFSKKMSILVFKKVSEIRYILANATIGEGVNIFAKTMLILDNIRGPSINADITQRNLLGRVGRFNQYFTGNRIIYDDTKGGSVVVSRLKKNVLTGKIRMATPTDVVDSNFIQTISGDALFSDDFIVRNKGEVKEKTIIPISKYTYPNETYRDIEHYVVGLNYNKKDTYLNSFFTFQNLYSHLYWFKEYLYDESNSSKPVLLFGRVGYRNVGYLVTLYLDYLEGVSIKTIIKRNINNSINDKVHIIV